VLVKLTPEFFPGDPRNPSSDNTIRSQFGSGFDGSGNQSALRKLQRFTTGANTDRITLEMFWPVTTRFGSTARFSRFNKFMRIAIHSLAATAIFFDIKVPVWFSASWVL